MVVLTRHDSAAEDEMLGLHVRDGALDVVEVVREGLQQRHPRAATQTPDTAESCGGYSETAHGTARHLGCKPWLMQSRSTPVH